MLTTNERLKQYFEEKNITQDEIAVKLKVSQAYVSSILTGKKGIGLSMVKKISNAYNLSVNWILNGDEKVTVEKQIVFAFTDIFVPPYFIDLEYNC